MWSFLGAPLIKRELIAVLRTRRAFWLLLTVVCLASLLPLLAWPEGAMAARGSYRHLYSFFFFALTQIIVSLLIVPAFTAGAISGERERGTYTLLYTTRLSPFSIVFAKTFASSGYVLLILVSTVPVAAVFHLMGGITLASILEVYLVTFIAVISSALVCLSESMRSRTTAHAVVRGVLWIVFWNGGLTLILLLGFGLLDSIVGVPDLEFLAWITVTTPFVPMSTSVYGDIFGGGAIPILPLVGYSIYAAILAALHGAYLLYRVRMPELPAKRVPLYKRTGSHARRKRTWFTRALLKLGALGLPFLGNPVFQKDVRSEYFGNVWHRRLLFWILFVLFLALAIFFAVEGGEAQLTVGVLGGIALVLVMIMAPAVASTSLTKEIERGNIDFLRGTLCSMGRVYAGKLLASGYALWNVIAATLIVSALVTPFAIDIGDWDELVGFVFLWPATAMILVCTTAFVVGACTFISLFLRRSVASVLLGFVFQVGLFIIVPIIFAMASLGGGSDEKFVFAAIHPVAALMIICEELDHNPDIPEAFTALFLHVVFYGGGAAMLIGLGASLAGLRLERDR